MSVFLAWYGGPSYRASSWTDDVEELPSIAAAVDLCRNRYANVDGRTPCVEYDEWNGRTAGLVFLYDPRADDVRDPYPDREITIGPRGGFKVSPC